VTRMPTRMQASGIAYLARPIHALLPSASLARPKMDQVASRGGRKLNPGGGGGQMATHPNPTPGRPPCCWGGRPNTTQQKALGRPPLEKRPLKRPMKGPLIGPLFSKPPERAPLKRALKGPSFEGPSRGPLVGTHRGPRRPPFPDGPW
jgi:hypothetical protein